MNWGRGLTLVIVLFLAVMMVMVYVAFQQSNEMIEDHYYDREIKYQQIIDGKNRLKNYEGFQYLQDSAHALYIHLPQPLSSHLEKGSVQLLKLDNEKYDKTVDILPVANRIIPSDSFREGGIYHVKLQWVDGKTLYFHEQDFHIKK